jgi:Uma2 family endonuclease
MGKFSYTLAMTQAVSPNATLPFLAHRFTVAEFERMFFAGVFSGETRAELLDGQVVMLTPRSHLETHEPHKYIIANYIDVLPDHYGKRLVMMPQMPLSVGLEHYQPEPDIALLRPPKTLYRERKNRAEDVLWLIEVSDSTLETDRSIKLPIYAASGIPEVWIHNVSAGKLEVYTQPNSENRRYERATTHHPGEMVAPLAFADEPMSWW